MGGSGALADALRRRLEAWRGQLRTSAEVVRIYGKGRAAGVELATGERVAARAVVSAMNPQTALLDLLDGPGLPERTARRLAARHRTNAVQFVVHAALDALPLWSGAAEGDWNGLQSVAASTGQVEQNFLDTEAGRPREDPAVYVYTPSAIDPSVAPEAGHTAYVACASYPARFADGSRWEERGEAEAHRLLEVAERRAPGFMDRVRGVAWRHAADWEREIGLLGGHPMHLDITANQVGPFRPLPELAGHRTPVARLYVSGAGRAPAGGVAGVPGRAGARAVLLDLRR